MGHQFLSTEWITSVMAVRDEYATRIPDVEVPSLRVNLQVTGVPGDVAADGVVLAHADTGGAGLVLNVGPLADPDLTVTLDYQTASTCW